MDISKDDINIIQDFCESKLLDYWDHEIKVATKRGINIRNRATTRIPIENWIRYDLNQRTFYSLEKDAFKTILDNTLVAAQKKYPERFGTGNAEDVIKAIIPEKPMFEMDLYQWKEFFGKEQFAFIFEYKEGNVVDNILRIDLYRLIQDNNKTNIREFTGGLFHAFKHFSIDNINLSMGNDKNEIEHPRILFKKIVEVFFLIKGTDIGKYYIVMAPFNEKFNLKLVFFKECYNMFFITSVCVDPI